MLPSWIKSRNNIPRPTYLLAIDTTNLKFAAASSFLACSSPSRIRFASSISCSWVNKSTRPISFKYILTGSLILTLEPNWFISSSSSDWLYILFVSPKSISRSLPKSRFAISSSPVSSSVSTSKPSRSSRSSAPPAMKSSSSISNASKPSSISMWFSLIASIRFSYASSSKSYLDWKASKSSWVKRLPLALAALISIFSSSSRVIPCTALSFFAIATPFSNQLVFGESQLLR